jgi:hypothetical protein
MLESINVRFFTVAYDHDRELDEIEITEKQFLELVNDGAVIEYERHTVFENGCRQVCLSLDPTSMDIPAMCDLTQV